MKEETQYMNGLRMLYSWLDIGLQRSPFLRYTRVSSRFSKTLEREFIKKMTFPQSSEVQYLYLLQNISLSLMFFLEISGFFVTLLNTRPSSKSLHLPAAIPEQSLHWWCLDLTSESTLGDGPGPCSNFLCAFFTTIDPLPLFS